MKFFSFQKINNSLRKLHFISWIGGVQQGLSPCVFAALYRLEIAVTASAAPLLSVSSAQAELVMFEQRLRQTVNEPTVVPTE